MDKYAELKDLEKSLLGIIAAITQTPSGKIKKTRMASKIATAKVAGAATSASIFALVSSYGTAGTLTPIGTLSGAAATNATLAWIGGLVGGGMAAGALLLPIAGIAVGTTATVVVGRKINGRPRKLKNLYPFEDEILFCAENLLQPLEAILKGQSAMPSKDELRVYAHDGLIPLLRKIRQHLSPLASNTDQNPSGFNATLKPKYQKQLRKHCENISKHAIIFSRKTRKLLHKKVSLSIKKSWSKLRKKPEIKTEKPYVASVVLAVTFQRMLEDQFTAWDLEQGLVLSALRRSNRRLEEASVQELSNYVRELSPEQLKGVVSNTKGIYHELLFVEMHNSVSDTDRASVMEAINHPGVDVQFHMDGDLVREVQLKAISSPSSIYEHMQRHPDVEILATEEMAAILEGVDSSGLNNAILSKDVTEHLYELQGEGFFEELSDRIITSAFVTSAVIAYRVLKYEDVKTNNIKSYLSNAGIAVGTTSVVDAAISLVGAS